MRLAMFMPYISNVVAVAIIWVMMYSPWGPFTQLVQMLGVENPPQWLGDYNWALPALMLMTVWSGVGYAVMIYTSAIQSLPKDVYEAADVTVRARSASSSRSPSISSRPPPSSW